MDNNIETVLYCSHINEADDRVAMGNSTSRTTGPGGYINRYDWRVWNASGFGQQIARSINNMNGGYTAEVSDFGRYVAVRVSYHNPATGKGVEKTYVVAFEDPKSGEGNVYATSTKWRTISNVSQAISYITSSIRSYAGETNRQ